MIPEKRKSPEICAISGVREPQQTQMNLEWVCRQLKPRSRCSLQVSLQRWSSFYNAVSGTSQVLRNWRNFRKLRQSPNHHHHRLWMGRFQSYDHRSNHLWLDWKQVPWNSSLLGLALIAWFAAGQAESALTFQLWQCCLFCLTLGEEILLLPSLRAKLASMPLSPVWRVVVENLSGYSQLGIDVTHRLIYTHT